MNQFHELLQFWINYFFVIYVTVEAAGIDNYVFALLVFAVDSCCDHVSCGKAINRPAKKIAADPEACSRWIRSVVIDKCMTLKSGHSAMVKVRFIHRYNKA